LIPRGLAQGTFSGAVAADDLALFGLEVYVAQRPDLAVFAVGVVGLSDLEQGVRLALELGDPAADVFPAWTAADEAQAVARSPWQSRGRGALLGSVRLPARLRAMGPRRVDPHPGSVRALLAHTLRGR